MREIGGVGKESEKRVRRDPADARELILQTAGKIMLDEGYAAVTMRRVAKSAGLSPTLVNYYYASADALLVALYRHSSDRDLEKLRAALASADLIGAIWAYQTDSARTVLGVEFLALANHRKEIRREIIRYAEYARNLQAQALARVMADHPLGCSPLCVITLITSISRNLIVENGVGISLGHDEAHEFSETMLQRLLAASGLKMPAEG